MKVRLFEGSISQAVEPLFDVVFVGNHHTINILPPEDEEDDEKEEKDYENDGWA